MTEQADESAMLRLRALVGHPSGQPVFEAEGEGDRGDPAALAKGIRELEPVVAPTGQDPNRFAEALKIARGIDAPAIVYLPTGASHHLPPADGDDQDVGTTADGRQVAGAAVADGDRARGRDGRVHRRPCL